MSHAVPACPSRVATPGEYVAALRQLRLSTGLTYREISRRATTAGHWLPPSTLAAALGRVTLPQERVVLALLAASGTPDAETRRWLAARNEIDMRLAEPARPDHPRPPEANRRESPPRSPAPTAAQAGVGRRMVRVAVASAVCALAGAAGLLAVWRHGRSSASASGIGADGRRFAALDGQRPVDDPMAGA